MSDSKAIEKAYELAKHHLNLHAIYAETGT